MLNFGGTTVLVFKDSSDFTASGALVKFNLSLIMDLGSSNFFFKNKHAQLCKFRLWFYFLFPWGLLELDWFYWFQWQYLPEFFCWLFAVMHGVCIVLGFESSIRVLDSSIRSLVWSIMLLLRMPLLRIVILYY